VQSRCVSLAVRSANLRIFSNVIYHFLFVSRVTFYQLGNEGLWLANAMHRRGLFVALPIDGLALAPLIRPLSRSIVYRLAPSLLYCQGCQPLSNHTSQHSSSSSKERHHDKSTLTTTQQRQAKRSKQSTFRLSSAAHARIHTRLESPGRVFFFFLASKRSRVCRSVLRTRSY
jgi:hypothetical protein